jgi:hypothetical protein
MGRPNSARGENIVELAGKLCHLAADDFDFVLDRRNFLHFDAQPSQLRAEKIRVAVAGFSRQDFVADNHDAGSFRHLNIS